MKMEKKNKEENWINKIEKRNKENVRKGGRE